MKKLAILDLDGVVYRGTAAILRFWVRLESRTKFNSTCVQFYTRPYLAEIVAMTEAKENQTLWNAFQQRPLTVNQVRAVDRIAVERYKMNSLVLMENAALGCVEWIVEKFRQPQKTVILCGNGNNGGDGLAIARHLQVRGWACEALLLGPIDKLSHDARANLEILTASEDSGVTIVGDDRHAVQERLFEARLILDAMLGTGATGNPRPPLDGWIEAANAADAFRLGIDLPTGIDAETGLCGQPYFRADTTVTFVALKPAMVAPDANQRFGEIIVKPIGIPRGLIREFLRDQ